MAESRVPYGDDGEPLKRNPDADPVKIHRDYVDARTGRGAPATAEAYQRALEQWHAIPGAVRLPPSELTGPEGLPSAGELPSHEPRGSEPPPASYGADESGPGPS